MMFVVSICLLSNNTLDIKSHIQMFIFIFSFGFWFSMSSIISSHLCLVYSPPVFVWCWIFLLKPSLSPFLCLSSLCCSRCFCLSLNLDLFIHSLFFCLSIFHCLSIFSPSLTSAHPHPSAKGVWRRLSYPEQSGYRDFRQRQPCG